MNKISEYDFLKKDIDFSYDKEIEFDAVAASEDTTRQKFIFYLLDLNYLDVLKAHEYNIAAIICPSHLKPYLTDFNIITCEQPKTLFFLIHNNLPDDASFPTIIEEDCIISDKSSIAPFNVIIKKGSVIEEYVSIKSGTTIGENCFIGAGSIIGTEGFNVFKVNGQNKLVKHQGHVIIGNNVVILSNSCVAKSIYKHVDTIIEDNVMIDNLVQVAHDAKIRKNAELAAGVVLCGFSEVGEETFMGVNSTIKQLKKVGANNKIGMGAFVNNNTLDNEIIAGPEPMRLSDARILKHHHQELIKEIKER